MGSPRKMTNESGVVVWTGAYQPFGEMFAGAGNVHGFTGKELDSEMGLNYFCQRYYDSQIGRFMTLDPFGGYIELPQTQNRYAYCINNPLKYIDPLGLDPQIVYRHIWIDGLEWWIPWDVTGISIPRFPRGYGNLGIPSDIPEPGEPRLADNSGAFSDWLSAGLWGADEGAYSDPFGGDYGDYFGGGFGFSGGGYGGGGFGFGGGAPNPAWGSTSTAPGARFDFPYDKKIILQWEISKQPDASSFLEKIGLRYDPTKASDNPWMDLISGLGLIVGGNVLIDAGGVVIFYSGGGAYIIGIPCILTGTYAITAGAQRIKYASEGFQRKRKKDRSGGK